MVVPDRAARPAAVRALATAALRRPYWRLGAAGAWEDIALLRRAEMVALFGAPILAERLGGVAKSWIALRAIDTSKG